MFDILKTDPYENYKVFSPDNKLMFRCSSKRAKWYLNKGLAKSISVNALQLNFQPNGLGHYGEDFFLQDRENCCVVCGNKQNLTKHHIVPRCYTRHFPKWYHAFNLQDIMPVCTKCHFACEQKYVSLKQQIAEEFAIVLDQDVNSFCKKEYKLLGFIRTITKYGNKIPKKRIDEMMQWIGENYGVNEFNDLSNVAFREIKRKRKKFQTHGYLVMQKVVNLHEFIRRWRWHFVNTMQPQFLPKMWEIDLFFERD